MKNYSIVLTSLVYILVGTNTAFSQWVQTNSFYGGYFTSFAVYNTTIFAGAYGDGLFFSTNNGASWTKTNLDDGTWINALAVSPNGTGNVNIFVGANGGAVGEKKGVILSTDNGRTWTEATTGLTNTNVTALAVLSNRTGGTDLFAATNGGGLFRSSDNGTSWTESDSGLGHPYIATLIVSGTNIFAGANYGGVFVSTNNGTNWSLVGSGLTNDHITALTVSEDGTSLFAGTDGGGVFLSTNNGAYWTSASSGLTNSHVRALVVSGKNIFAGTDGGGVFLSTDNGTTWNPVNTGLNFPYVRAFGVVPNGTAGINIFAGTWGNGIFLSTNNGANWTSVNSGLICRCVNTLAAYDSNIFVGTNGCGAFESTDDGASWSQINGGVTFPNVYALGVVPNDHGGKNLVAGSGGIFLSSDNGSSWILTTPNYRPGDVHAFAMLRSESGETKIFAGDNNMDNPNAHVVQIYLSKDEGFTWVQFGVDINASRVNALAVSDTNLFVGTDNRGIFLTADGGMTWTPRNNGLTDACINALTVFTDSAGNVSIFAATNSGIFVSTDNGLSWNLAYADPVSTQAQALAICRRDMLAGASAKVWKRPLSEMVTAVETKGNNFLTQFSLSQNYPNPFNPSTNISFTILSKSFVSLKVFDALGREVSVIISEELSAGSYLRSWNAQGMASGIYFCRLQASSFTETKKLVLLR
jgi:photosystem II stability/assembly factor-like uncharacterized protein